MGTTLTGSESAEINVERTMDIGAPVETVFETVLECLGPLNTTPDGDSMHLKLEPWPGGRWYRDLSDGAGHLWGHVQVIKPPRLLEITGPLFMSYPVASHVQWRLTTLDGGGARIALTHRAIGAIESEHAEGVDMGWAHMLDLVRKTIEK